MPCQVWATCYSEFFKCQGKPKYILVSTILASACHWALSYLLCVVFDLKFKGIAIATACYFTIRFLIRVIICRLDEEFKLNRISLLDKLSWTDLGQVH